MEATNALVVCYSRTGTTRKLADAIAARLGCAVEAIVDQDHRGGVLGFVRGGIDALRKRTASVELPDSDPADYDLVVIGTPVWAGTLTPAVRAYVEHVRDHLPEVAFFLTTGGSGIEKTFRDMEALCGRSPRATLGLRAGIVKKDAFDEELSAFCDALAAP